MAHMQEIADRFHKFIPDSTDLLYPPAYTRSSGQRASPCLDKMSFINLASLNVNMSCNNAHPHFHPDVTGNALRIYARGYGIHCLGSSLFTVQFNPR